VGAASNLKPWQPGQSGNPSGRARRVLPRPDQVLADKGISPVEEILKLLPELRPTDQVKTWLELLSYCAAKPKGHADDDDEARKLSAMSDGELLQLVREKLPALEDECQTP
jgi:hypothetical protein